MAAVVTIKSISSCGLHIPAREKNEIGITREKPGNASHINTYRHIP